MLLAAFSSSRISRSWLLSSSKSSGLPRMMDSERDQRAGPPVHVAPIAALDEIGDGYFAGHGAVVVEVHEFGQHAAQVPVDQVQGHLLGRPPADALEQGRRPGRRSGHRGEDLDQLAQGGGAAGLGRRLGWEIEIRHQMAHGDRFVDLEVLEGEAGRTVAPPHLEGATGQCVHPDVRLDDLELLVGELEFGRAHPEGGIGLLAFAGQAAGKIEDLLVPGRLDGIQLEEGLEKGGLAGFVLAHQRSDLGLDLDPARVLDAAVVLDPDPA